jgi:mono/diheme cytochrome c family protein
VKSFSVDWRARYANRNRVLAVSFLALAGVAGALLVGRSPALAQPQPAPAAQRGGGGAPAGNAENGKAVFASSQCATCHGNQGQGGSGPVVGPQIAAPSMALADFVDKVRNAKAPMPAFTAGQVSDASLADVYAFLRTVSAPGQPVMSANANADNGKKLYLSAGCYECHSREGQGGEGTGPRLAPNPIGFAAFVNQLRKPSNQMPPYTGKVLTDAQVSDIYAFLQSIPKAPDVARIPLLQ